MPTGKAPAPTRKHQREANLASIQASQFVREEIERIREAERAAIEIKGEAVRKATKKATRAVVSSRAAGATRAARTRTMRSRMR